jgi:hypothetical protein
VFDECIHPRPYTWQEQHGGPLTQNMGGKSVHNTRTNVSEIPRRGPESSGAFIWFGHHVTNYVVSTGQGLQAVSVVLVAAHCSYGSPLFLGLASPYRSSHRRALISSLDAPPFPAEILYTQGTQGEIVRPNAWNVIFIFIVFWGADEISFILIKRIKKPTKQNA